jgi:hypothetical protein
VSDLAGERERLLKCLRQRFVMRYLFERYRDRGFDRFMAERPNAFCHWVDVGED